MENIANTIIIGAGPAAYTAGLYLARANLKPIIYEGNLPGGQLLTTTEVENFPSNDSILGYDLVNNMREQCIKYGAICIPEFIKSVKYYDDKKEIFSVETEDNIYLTKTIIVATGANAKKMYFKNSDIFWNKGISACAVCDGALPMFRNKNLIVIGGGDSAMEEAIFLTKFAKKVIILHRSIIFKASAIMLERAKKNEKIEFINGEVIEANIKDDNSKVLEKVKYINKKTNEEEEIECNGIFYAIGHEPNTKFLDNICNLKSNGYLYVKPYSSETSVTGIFGAGDVVDDKYRQAITASGMGCMAALDCIKFLEK